jgi:tripartite-type tricarboxylate transporter receptor subunit TctC
MAELVALLKEHPSKFTFSSGGFSTPAHLTGELFKLQTGVRAPYVPYRALPQAIGDLVNGTNHYQFTTALPVLDLIAAGKLRALAVTAPTRMPSLKDVPSVAEEGFPQLVIQEWAGLVVKSGTPDPIIARLNEATNKALAKPSVRAALQKIAAEPAGGSPSEFGGHEWASCFGCRRQGRRTAWHSRQRCRAAPARRRPNARRCEALRSGSGKASRQPRIGHRGA